MIKKSLKYLIVIFVNALLLTILLAVWTDRFELTFNENIRFVEFLKIIGISLLGLIILRLAVSFFRNYKLTSPRKKIIFSSLIMIGISSFLYFNYIKKTYENRIRNKEIRTSAIQKVKNKNSYPHGSNGQNLTIKEYTEITNTCWFPTISKEANNISYHFYYDGFLPDYSLELTYDVPKNITIDTLNSIKGQFTRSQTFQIIENVKKVHYQEIQR